METVGHEKGPTVVGPDSQESESGQVGLDVRDPASQPDHFWFCFSFFFGLASLPFAATTGAVQWARVLFGGGASLIHDGCYRQHGADFGDCELTLPLAARS